MRGLHRAPAQNGLPVPTVGWREIDTMTVVDGHPVPILGTGSAVPTKHAKNGHGSAHAWDPAGVQPILGTACP